MADFLIEKLFDNTPCIIVFSPDLDRLMQADVLKSLLDQGYTDQLVFLDLLLRNGVGDRFYTIKLENGKWNNPSCKPVVLTEEQFAATSAFYKNNLGLLDNNCGILHNAQKYLMKCGSDKHLFRNYCYFEKRRGTLAPVDSLQGSV